MRSDNSDYYTAGAAAMSRDGDGVIATPMHARNDHDDRSWAIEIITMQGAWLLCGYASSANERKVGNVS